MPRSTRVAPLYRRSERGIPGSGAALGTKKRGGNSSPSARRTPGSKPSRAVQQPHVRARLRKTYLRAQRAQRATGLERNSPSASRVNVRGCIPPETSGGEAVASRKEAARCGRSPQRTGIGVFADRCPHRSIAKAAARWTLRPRARPRVRTRAGCAASARGVHWPPPKHAPRGRGGASLPPRVFGEQG